MSHFSTHTHTHVPSEHTNLGLEGLKCKQLQFCKGIMVVAQLTEWLLPMSEVCSLNPVIRIFYAGHVLLLTVEKKKRSRMGHF